MNFYKIIQGTATSNFDRILSRELNDTQKITGTPPLTFMSDGSPLVDYTIYGAAGGVGDRTANLMPSAEKQTVTKDGLTLSCDGQGRYQIHAENIGARTSIFLPLKNSFTIPVSIGNGGQGTLSMFNTGGTSAAGTFLFWKDTTQVTYVMLSTQNRKFNAYSIPTFDCNRIGVQFTAISGELNIDVCPMFADTGEYPAAFEPYGYKIPITCGGVTTNIYLDTPLYEGDSISFSAAGVKIPTIEGENTLTIGTTVQPEKISIVYKR